MQTVSTVMLVRIASSHNVFSRASRYLVVHTKSLFQKVDAVSFVSKKRPFRHGVTYGVNFNWLLPNYTHKKKGTAVHARFYLVPTLKLDDSAGQARTSQKRDGREVAARGDPIRAAKGLDAFDTKSAAIVSQPPQKTATGVSYAKTGHAPTRWPPPSIPEKKVSHTSKAQTFRGQTETKTKKKLTVRTPRAGARPGWPSRRTACRCRGTPAA